MKQYFKLVTFSHTIFAMPFALVGFTLGILKAGHFDPWLLLKVILCMVTARNAAMAFNRFIDRDIDARNPRTVGREIPSGRISPKRALLFTIINVLIFIVVCWTINLMCFILSPVALAVILGYSLTKRFTAICHFILGLGLSLAPIGAYLAVTSSFDIIVILIGFSVLCWVAGFDIIYSLQDDDFDKSQSLYSIPALLGRKNALRVSELSHLISAVFLIVIVFQLDKNLDETGIITMIGCGIFLIMLLYQHLIISDKNLSKVNLAFMTTNGIASIIFGLCLIVDLVLI